MNFITFQIQKSNLDEFMDHWSRLYLYDSEEKYTSNIGKPLTEKSRIELFEWKNGSKISQNKMDSILENYPLEFSEDKADRYLNYKKSGGAIWNIFYLHCLDPSVWPIFDQHTYRAMKYLMTRSIVEIGNTNKKKFESYLNEYKPFLASLKQADYRKTDKALFAFGQFLKIAAKYI
ncbi:hypothetical protein [Nitrosomonas sp.]|uniref:hypothetical protein n=1 Tax=Nitrosomonas sp. TaxID=42353 RepID=UPI0025FABB31|nr:hypothetical protein [Nitrosomonas sp.]